jgi:hypothetical protein
MKRIDRNSTVGIVRIKAPGGCGKEEFATGTLGAVMTQAMHDMMLNRRVPVRPEGDDAQDDRPDGTYPGSKSIGDER